MSDPDLKKRTIDHALTERRTTLMNAVLRVFMFEENSHEMLSDFFTKDFDFDFLFESVFKETKNYPDRNFLASKARFLFRAKVLWSLSQEI